MTTAAMATGDKFCDEHGWNACQCRPAPFIVQHPRPPEDVMTINDVLDVAGATQLLKVGRDAIYSVVATGHIPHKRVGRCWRRATGPLSTTGTIGSRTVNDARRLDQLRRAQRAIRGRGLFGSWF